MSTAQTRTLRVGTRRSLLARTQSGQVAALLAERLGVEVELVEVVTEGDTNQTSALASLGGTGVFVSALRDALLRGDVDVAVHSLKDLPTGPFDGIALAAVPLREDPRDALVARDGLTLGELPAGSVVATGSPRRVAQLAALGLGLEIVGLRGNIDTRLGKVTAGEVDAVILARAGLARIDRLDVITETLDPIQMLPAPGQGALAIECRSADASLVEELREALEDPFTRAAVDAERALLRGLEAGCAAPVGALAEVAEADEPEDGHQVWLRAVALAPDGGVEMRRSASGPLADAAAVGERLAQDMLDEGAAQLIEEPVRKQQA
jgi:hydroxymethylbilane synthase